MNKSVSRAAESAEKENESRENKPGSIWGALRGSIFLTLGALIWGCAFVAQNVSMDHIGPFAFNCLRSILGSIVLLPLIYFSERKDRSLDAEQPEQKKKRRASELRIILIMGLAVFVPTTLQQIGLITTSPGKSGFITAMYVVAVPILSIVIGKRLRPAVLISVALAVVGLYLLCVSETLSIERGDVVTLVSVFFWAIQIMLVGHFSKNINSIKMTSGAFFICGILSFLCMIAFERPTWDGIAKCMVPLLYTGIMSTGAGYSLQAAGQKTTPSVLASLIMSLESVFSVLAGYVILGDTLTARELSGCGLMLAAVILAQLLSVGGEAKNRSSKRSGAQA